MWRDQLFTRDFWLFLPLYHDPLWYTEMILIPEERHPPEVVPSLDWGYFGTALLPQAAGHSQKHIQRGSDHPHVPAAYRNKPHELQTHKWKAILYWDDRRKQQWNSRVMDAMERISAINCKSCYSGIPRVCHLCKWEMEWCPLSIELWLIIVLCDKHPMVSLGQTEMPSSVVLMICWRLIGA